MKKNYVLSLRILSVEVELAASALNELWHRQMAVYQILRPAAQVVEHGLGDIDPHLSVECRKDFPKGHRSVRGFAGMFVRGANDLSMAHATAGK